MNAHVTVPAQRSGEVILDRPYLKLLGELYDGGLRRTDRTGVGTRGVFGRQMRFDLRHAFPLLTTKRVHFRSVALELLWFLSGSTNINELQGAGCRIWNEWADADGELGPVYGKQWRSWSAPNGQVIDQIAQLVEGLRADPYSRRHVVSAWNPADIGVMALPPCHCLFQFHVTPDVDGPGQLSCQLYQRSADIFLGVPFNIASYALLTHMVAKVVGLTPGDFVHTLGDAHLYLNHLDQAAEQLCRDPRPAPRLELPTRNSLEDYTLEDCLGALVAYEPHPAIPAPIAV